jgi:structural maintenance of chromosome 3 (chondroitin sulfate proteoglycan 6)
MNFNQQRQQFVERFESLSNDKIKIQELMDGLDQQKEEAIWRTFQGVSKHFSEVFKELVPFGDGSLIMIKATDSFSESGVEEMIREEKVSQGRYHGPSIDEFLGVRVKVSFSDAIQQCEMHQLSGGQKALVALALIFAIQRFVFLFGN